MINSKKRNLIKSKQTNLKTKNRRNTKRYSKKSNRKYIKKNTNKKGGMDIDITPPLTCVQFAPVIYKADMREKPGSWGPNDYILLAHGGDIKGTFLLEEGQSIRYHFYCPPGSKLNAVDGGELEHIRYLKRNMLKPCCIQDAREQDLQRINNYTLHPSQHWQAGLYTAGMEHLIMSIDLVTTFETITQSLFQYLKNNPENAFKSEIPQPNLYVNICLQGSTDLNNTKQDSTSLENIFTQMKI